MYTRDSMRYGSIESTLSFLKEQTAREKYEIYVKWKENLISEIRISSGKKVVNKKYSKVIESKADLKNHMLCHEFQYIREGSDKKQVYKFVREGAIEKRDGTVVKTDLSNHSEETGSWQVITSNTVHYWIKGR